MKALGFFLSQFWFQSLMNTQESPRERLLVGLFEQVLNETGSKWILLVRKFMVGFFHACHTKAFTEEPNVTVVSTFKSLRIVLTTAA